MNNINKKIILYAITLLLSDQARAFIGVSIKNSTQFPIKARIEKQTEAIIDSGKQTKLYWAEIPAGKSADLHSNIGSRRIYWKTKNPGTNNIETLFATRSSYSTPQNIDIKYLIPKRGDDIYNTEYNLYDITSGLKKNKIEIGEIPYKIIQNPGIKEKAEDLFKKYYESNKEKIDAEKADKLRNEIISQVKQLDKAQSEIVYKFAKILQNGSSKLLDDIMKLLLSSVKKVE
jgi:hypothetical protein